MLRLLIIISCLFLEACSTIPSASRWHETAFISLREPEVWGPVVGAVLVKAQDKHISRSAREKTPVFGSQQEADKFSEDAKTALKQIAMLSAVVAGIQSEDVGDSMTRQLFATAFMLDVSNIAITEMKDAISRERPDASDKRSFPSANAMTAFAGAHFTSQNMHRQEWFKNQQWLADTLLYGTASAVAWGRVEAGRHYASDVLVGAAIGNFFASWAQLLWLDSTGRKAFTVVPDQSGISLNLSMTF